MQENVLNKFRTIVSEASFFVGNPVYSNQVHDVSTWTCRVVNQNLSRNLTIKIIHGYLIKEL